MFRDELDENIHNHGGSKIGMHGINVWKDHLIGEEFIEIYL